METKNILNEVSELLNSTNENLKFVISRSGTNYVGLLKSIHTTLANVGKVLKRESCLNDKQRADFEKEYNLEKAWNMRAFFFMSEKGYINEFKEYCTNNPLDEFKEFPIERIKRQLKK